MPQNGWMKMVHPLPQMDENVTLDIGFLLALPFVRTPRVLFLP